MGSLEYLEIELKSKILNFDPFVKSLRNSNVFLLDGNYKKKIRKDMEH